MAGDRTLVPEQAAVLRPFVDAGVFEPLEVHLAAAMGRLGGLEVGDATDDAVVLAVAVAAAAVRRGHVCVDLAVVAGQLVDDDTRPDLPWPDPTVWLEMLRGHRLVAGVADRDDDPVRPVVLDGDRLYLHRAHSDETRIHGCLVRRLRTAHARGSGDPADTRVFDRIFGVTTGPEDDDLQRQAVEVALCSPVSILAGGPGTGKTWTIARLLVAALELDPSLEVHQIALAAPTGKAAARMTDALQRALAEQHEVVDEPERGNLAALTATTLHRLLGLRPGRTPRHDARNPLRARLVVVDETSMVDLAMMAALTDALADDARLVLVGDPFQLASVEAGTVLRDLVGPTVDPGSTTPRGPLADAITVLERVHRFAEDQPVGRLADAIRTGDADAALALLDVETSTGGDGPGEASVTRIAPDDHDRLAVLEAEIVDAACQVVEAARDGDGRGALDAVTRCKVLAATRQGPRGLAAWSRQVEQRVMERMSGVDPSVEWFVGRPVLVTRNDAGNAVANGDTGVVVATERGPMVALADGAGVRLVAPARLPHVETWWAMTIHKSQGSEFAHVVVALPDRSSPIVTRELLYTAVTRARERVTIVADEQTIRHALATPVTRASGLYDRLWASPKG